MISSPSMRGATPTFQLRMEAEVSGLIEEGGRVVGVRGATPDGGFEVRADLVVGADGRHSAVRQSAGLAIDDIGAPMDVLWMRLSRQPDDPAQTLGRFDAGRILVMLNREDYWQCAFVIAKGGFDEIRQRGLPAFREEVATARPLLARPNRRVARLGRRQAVERRRSTACGYGIGPGCCASATRPTRCRRSAASASISRSRTPWRRRTFSLALCCRQPSARTI